jgi:hypothetical protein
MRDGLVVLIVQTASGMRSWSVLVALVALVVPARAETSATPAAVDLPVAVGVSSPLGWPYGTFGASVYVGFGDHIAVRGNLAWYESDESLLEGATAALADGDVGSYSGSFRDAGLAAIWYPRKLWSGLTLEAGVLQRARDTGYQPELADGVKTKSTTYAGRAMIGWSWPIGRYVFVAIAIGLSAGTETGQETIIPDNPTKMPTTRPVQRTQVDGEGYFRIGLALGR